MRITNQQKNELSKIFRETGLNLLDFETTGQFQEFKIQFRHEYFSFSISIRDKDSYMCTVLPVDNTKGYSIGGNWETTKKRFSRWIYEIADELNTPTGWESFQSNNYLNATFEELEESFSQEEKNQVIDSLNQFREKVKTLELSTESLLAIDKKLEDLSEKVDELSKFDWKSLFIGTIASLIMTLGIPPEVNGIFWEYIKSAFGGLQIKG